MSRPATSHLKVNPPLGMLPVLQYCLPAQLQIDESYQRSLEAGASQSLIRSIATFWDWDLCQPLVVARRDDGRLFVVDGQHRLAAARMRGDIVQLPCVISSYTSAAAEAASFVALNQRRRPLSQIDIFKAALAAGDETALAIHKAMLAAGLRLSASPNLTTTRPGAVYSIGGIRRQWARVGPRHTAAALRMMGKAFEGQILRYFGTIFGGVAMACAEVYRIADEATVSELGVLLAGRSQAQWRDAILRRRGEEPTERDEDACRALLIVAWRKESAASKPTVRAPPPRDSAAGGSHILRAVRPPTAPGGDLGLPRSPLLVPEGGMTP